MLRSTGFNFAKLKLNTGLLSQWHANKNGLINPLATDISPNRLAWWTCQSCDTSFKRKIQEHIKKSGKCEECGEVPAKVSQKEAQGNLVNCKAATQKRSQNKVWMKDKRNFSPMLAQQWPKRKDEISDKEPLYVSAKLDGIRCVAAWDKDAKEPYFMSRHGKVFMTCDEVRKQLTPLFHEDPLLVLDGELYNHKLKDQFSSLNAAVRSNNPEYKPIHDVMQYHIFDLLHWSVDSKVSPDFPTRHLQLLAFVNRITKNYQFKMSVSAKSLFELDPALDNVKVLVAKQASCAKADMDTILRMSLDAGYEGLIIRVGDNPYSFGKRPPHMLKHKDLQDDEFEILDWKAGEGKCAGQMGSLLCQTKSGIQFSATCYDTNGELWKQRNNLIGKMATVKYELLSESGVPRSGRVKAIRGSKQHKADWL